MAAFTKPAIVSIMTLSGLVETQYVLLDFHPRMAYPIVRQCRMKEDRVRHDSGSNDSYCKEEFGRCAEHRYD